MRRIQHAAVDLHHAAAADGERGKCALGLRTFGLGRRKTAADDIDLRGMDRGLGGKSVAACNIDLESLAMLTDAPEWQEGATSFMEKREPRSPPLELRGLHWAARQRTPGAGTRQIATDIKPQVD